MTRVLITGATGFIGSHVARELLAAGYEVRALVRPAAPKRAARNPLDPRLEVAPGDLRDPKSLRDALAGCELLVHVAADYRLWVPDQKTMYATNLIGTRHLLLAALQQGVRRVVYTSSVAACGLPSDGTPGTEASPLNHHHLAGIYKRTKYLAEREALWLARDEGLPLVIVNPSTPIGPGDVKPTPTGRIIIDFLRGRIPAYVNTGLNLIAVEDCARGHVLALEQGRLGERYILGNRNLSLQELLGMLAALTGRQPPRVRLPRWVAYAAAYADELIEGHLLRREPGIPVNGVRLSSHYMYFDASKAVRELGLPQTSIEEALERAIAWFRAQGYVPTTGVGEPTATPAPG
jgi:dihydroflavonol-4-reductase